MIFAERVYSLLKKVPKGRVTTYKALGDALGTRAYRAVGQALRHNPYAPSVPCHRVVSSNGSIGGFNGKTSGKDIARKKKMLEDEGILFNGNMVRDFYSVKFVF
ncbi:MAG: MGMT family protein [Nanoarchaeota archaeon]|nr:MGMT family protein [Nanoarchaeota archaeon]